MTNLLDVSHPHTPSEFLIDHTISCRSYQPVSSIPIFLLWPALTPQDRVGGRIETSYSTLSLFLLILLVDVSITKKSLLRYRTGFVCESAASSKQLCHITTSDCSLQPHSSLRYSQRLSNCFINCSVQASEFHVPRRPKTKTLTRENGIRRRLSGSGCNRVRSSQYRASHGRAWALSS